MLELLTVVETFMWIAGISRLFSVRAIYMHVNTVSNNETGSQRISYVARFRAGWP